MLPLVQPCWMKMRQRIIHRYSGAMFTLLTELKPQAMQIFFQKFASQLKPSSREDSGLTSMLVSLENRGLLQSFLEQPLEGFVPTSSTDGKSLLDELRAASSSQSQPGLGAYNEHTCFVFHVLLIATIRGFQVHLRPSIIIRQRCQGGSRELHPPSLTIWSFALANCIFSDAHPSPATVRSSGLSPYSR